jgi:hypothetical protein
MRVSSSVEISTTVLYTCDPQYVPAYEQLKSDHLSVKFLEQRNFSEQILEWIENVPEYYLMFCCDDVFFKLPWEPDRIIEYLSTEEDLIAFSLRLGKEICFCHPLNHPSPNPEFIRTEPFLVWNWKRAEGPDWRMPLELNCTIISRDVVNYAISVMDHCEIDWGHPNRLESHGGNLIQEIDGPHLMASYDRARANCLAINRVQEEHRYPIYSGNKFTAERLLKDYEIGFRLDVKKYRDQIYDRIHIGDVFLRQISKPKRDI